jgi:hypothetical protein
VISIAICAQLGAYAVFEELDDEPERLEWEDILSCSCHAFVELELDAYVGLIN